MFQPSIPPFLQEVPGDRFPYRGHVPGIGGQDKIYTWSKWPVHVLYLERGVEQVTYLERGPGQEGRFDKSARDVQTEEK